MHVGDVLDDGKVSEHAGIHHISSSFECFKDHSPHSIKKVSVKRTFPFIAHEVSDWRIWSSGLFYWIAATTYSCWLITPFKAARIWQDWQAGLWHGNNMKIVWLRDTVKQTSLGKSAAAKRIAGPPRPLTSRGTSAWPYRVTTQYSFYPVWMYS